MKERLPSGEYRFIAFGERPIIAIDGTKFHSSEKIKGKDSNVYIHNKKGKPKKEYTEYAVFAVLVGIPDRIGYIVGIEFITRNTKNDKQGCENVAAKRLLKRLYQSKVFPKAIILGDAFYANTPIGSLIKQFPGWDFICNCKPGSNKTVFDFVNGVQLDSITKKIQTERGPETWMVSWMNNVPLTNSKNPMRVNYISLDVIESRKRGPRKDESTADEGKHFTWISSIEISPEHAVKLAQLGRSRWNIENGTFNLLKNQGYNLTHNFAHRDTLCYIITSLMAVAFNIHYMLSVREIPWAKALALTGTTKAFFIELTSVMAYYPVGTTEELVKIIIWSRSEGG
jgi:hypothetical protein